MDLGNHRGSVRTARPTPRPTAPDDRTLGSLSCPCRARPGGGSWADLQQAIAGNDPRTTASELLCYIAVFGRGNGVLDGIDRVCRALAVGIPAELRGRVAVQRVPSCDPDADKPGTLYLNCVFRPGTPQNIADDICRWTLAAAIPTAIRHGAGTRVIWRKDDEIAAALMTVAGSPHGGIQ